MKQLAYLGSHRCSADDLPVCMLEKLPHALNDRPSTKPPTKPHTIRMISACRGSSSVRKYCGIWDGIDWFSVADIVLPTNEISMSLSAAVVTAAGREVLRVVSFTERSLTDSGCVSIRPVGLLSELCSVAVDEEDRQRECILDNRVTERLLD